MKRIIGLICYLSFSMEAYSMGAKRPTIPSTPPVPPTVSVKSGPISEQIKALVIGSACANYSFKNRGTAPIGYLKGVALTYGRSLCRYKSNDQALHAIAQIMGEADTNNDSLDALAHYQNNFLNLGFDIFTAGAEPLRAVYTLGIGLGMRESSGSYCEGWDTSAGSNRLSATAEAGAFQTSYDSLGASPILGKLYNEYQTNKASSCFLEVFKEGANCSMRSILGTGAGADFQAFNIACPGFATEEAMGMLRIRRSHYGPINRQEAEVVPACDQLLKNVESIIDQNTASACQELL